MTSSSLRRLHLITKRYVAKAFRIISVVIERTRPRCSCTSHHSTGGRLGGPLTVSGQLLHLACCVLHLSSNRPDVPDRSSYIATAASCAWPLGNYHARHRKAMVHQHQRNKDATPAPREKTVTPPSESTTRSILFGVFSTALPLLPDPLTPSHSHMVAVWVGRHLVDWPLQLPLLPLRRRANTEPNSNSENPTAIDHANPVLIERGFDWPARGTVRYGRGPRSTTVDRPREWRVASGSPMQVDRHRAFYNHIARCGDAHSVT
jgi:hypothetical protein